MRLLAQHLPREPAHMARASASLSVSYTISCDARAPFLSVSQTASASWSVPCPRCPRVAFSVSLSCSLATGELSVSVGVSLRIAEGVSLVLYVFPEPALSIVLRVARLPLCAT